ncbi:glycosyl hydrolase family 18 [Colletotrichum sp. SAR11_59]|nr:glycosyl hydrolase family 18 [Colletotrichum sp. SAR11_59]
MSIEQMPVESLTHLMFSFAYVTPGDFRIAPMDDLDPKLFNQMTAMKKQNRALKVMVALGGWTFNDTGPTQQVFHDVASSKANRAKFIANLLSFMRQYAFDGVDFDWEYPGADDRGGAEEDGKNFTLLLEELRDAIKTQPLDYTVSFTTPTSFWYLRHFDLKASTAAVDFVNIMSYDLHGVWDAWNPIGSNVLAHTNLTKIKLALDLYWRNEIPPEKLNLGIGFYGRTFELSDASCYKPECQFKGGAAPGPDDADTIEAKIKFANSQGLGGLLIWSIDQDTDKLDALTAVVGKDVMSSISRASLAKDSAYWQDMGAQNCYVTDCGGKCDKKGFKAVTTQPCGSAKAVTRRSSKADSTLCCPIDSAPDPADCKWRTRGNAPTCNGRCEYGEVGLQLNKWGDGKYCEDGHKMYCCKTNSVSGHENKCSFNSKGKKCPSGQSPLTFAGEFGKGNIGEKKPDVDFERLNKLKGSSLMSEIEKYEWSQLKLYCCPDEDTSKWNSCEWKGKPRSCFDAHCDLDTQVMLTWAGFGGGEGYGEPLFLPVGLEHLFPNPPTGDDVKTKSHSKIDGTWGGSQSSSADDPNKAAIQFYVMASPTEIQVSVDKRDGSHWELFNCKDAHSHSSQTVQMSLPRHLTRRNFSTGGNPVVYDLKFGYDFSLVSREFGDTQLRIDYSNQEGCWNHIVSRPVSKKRKRYLEDFGGSHKRWLEEEWRDDAHFGGVTREELHKRWFGDDILEWLEGLTSTNIKMEKRHEFEEQVSAIIL